MRVGSAWMMVALLACGSAKAGPSVSKQDVALVPEAWRAEWSPFEQALREAMSAETAARSATAEPERSLASAEKNLASAEDAVSKAEKAQKAARKAKDVAQANAVATSMAAAREQVATATRERDVAAAELALAQAVVVLREAEVAVASTRLESVRARAVADAGGWVDMERFQVAEDEAKARIAPAEKAVESAKARIVLAGQ